MSAEPDARRPLSTRPDGAPRAGSQRAIREASLPEEAGQFDGEWRTPATVADVAIRVYENDKHMFYTGTGPSTPADYEPAQHTDAAVVADIATWLTSR